MLEHIMDHADADAACPAETEEQAADNTHPEATPTQEETKGFSGGQTVEAKSALSRKPTTEENMTGTKGAPSASTSESTTKDGTEESEDLFSASSSSTAVFFEMYSLDELKSFYDTGGDWTSDLACVPDLSERCVEAHFASSNRQQHKGQNRLPVQPLMEITFKKHVINKAVPAKAKRRLPPSLPGADGSLKSLQEEIAKDAPNLLWNRYSGGKRAPLQNISAIPDIEDLLSLKCIEMFKKKLSEQMPLSDVERASVCERTIGQNENAEWMKERTGRLTASNFHRIIHCVKPEGLVKDILYPRKQGPLKQGDPRLYGLENEDLAGNAYKTVMLLYDKDIQLVKTGLHVDVTHSFVAASPDRIVKDGSDVGLLEVKCPASKAGQAVLDACMDKTFCAEVVDGEVRLKRTHTYFYQVQGQLGVTQKPWCDFVIWTNHADLHKSDN
ncbi:hypothetical protein HPB49_009068 [Dermacentor silvarum]|uniref:Uncharacterized protein n=1 Tax=Dermacentor silvarum TaxID=543639 RepID=A0ACB8DY04_DERSI|nr:hypothetical protein HPB49_009068 [Dermacentor silvarum]